jgi:hypothetical protein
MLRKMGNKLERLEDDIFEGERPAEIVRDISNVKQEIINFRRVVRPQRAALKDLEATKRYIPDDLEIYFDDINDASERIWDMLENYKEVVEALESTNEAVLSHRLERHLPRPHRDQRHRPAADAHRLDLGHEHQRARRGLARRLLAVVGVMVIVLVATIALFKRRGGLASSEEAPRRAAGLAGEEAGGAPRCLVQAAAGGMALPGQGRGGRLEALSRVEEGASVSRLEGFA